MRIAASVYAAMLAGGSEPWSACGRSVRLIATGLLLAAAACGATSAAAQSAPTAGPKTGAVDELEGLDIVERRGETVPLDLVFKDGRGNDVPLSSLIDGTRPVLLSLNYSACPMLCGLQMNGLSEALRELAYEPGEEYRFLSVSINPLESPQTAASSRTNFLKRIDRRPAAGGIEFLVGRQEAIRQLADAVGFQYRYLRDRREYVHFPVLIVLTPRGVISRYLYGVSYNPSDLRLSLVEAGDGTISSVYEKVLLSCFRYDRQQGKYTPFAWGLVRFAGVVTLCVMTAVLVPAWLGWNRSQRAAVVEAGGPDDDPRPPPPPA